MSLWAAIGQIAGWLTLGGTAVVVLVGLGIWLRLPILLYAAGGVLAGTIAYGIGVAHEKMVCDARFKVAQERFEKLQREVDELTERFKTATDAENEKQEKESAEKLKVVLERLAREAGAKCTASATDVDDDRRLRRTAGPGDTK